MLNGTNQRPSPMPKPAVWSKRARAVRMTLLLLPPPVRMSFVLMLGVLVTLCSGCATSSPPDQPARNPAPPKLSEPIPSESYLSKALRLIESWQSKPTDM